MGDERDERLRRARARMRLERRRHGPSAAKRQAERASAVLVVTTAEVPGRDVLEVVGIVTPEVARTIDMVTDLAVARRDDLGGRSDVVERTLRLARAECLEQLALHAATAGADAVLAVRLDVAAPTKSVFLVSAAGTAVRLLPDQGDEEVPGTE